MAACRGTDAKWEHDLRFAHGSGDHFTVTVTDAETRPAPTATNVDDHSESGAFDHDRDVAAGTVAPATQTLRQRAASHRRMLGRDERQPGRRTA